MPAEFCNPCRARYGQIRAGVHRLNHEPVCEECFHGGNADAIARCRKSRVNVEAGSPRQEETVSERICDTCRKPMHGRTKGTTCRACREASSKGASSNSSSAPRATAQSREHSRRRKGGSVTALAKRQRAVNGSSEEVLVALTPRLSALIWSGVASLPPAQQAALLSKLPEME